MRFAVGQSPPRAEDRRLLTGRGRYTDDFRLPNEARAHVLRSPHACAAIRGLDTAAAAAAPGVLGVFTGADLEASGLGALPTPVPTLVALARPDGAPLYVPRWMPLVSDRVRMVGDPVALVVAETLEQARDAADLVEVDYEPGPAVTDVGLAAAPDAPRVWPQCADNLAYEHRVGDHAAAEAAFARAARVVRTEVAVSRVCTSPMEPLAAVGEYDPVEGRYTLYAGTQMPHMLRKWLASEVLGVPESAVRVVSRDMGGSFGLRSTAFPELVLTLWAARRLGRPVKHVSERSETMLASDQARDMRYTVELALDEAGEFLAVRVDGLAALGAYVTFFGPFPGFANLGGLAGPYRTPVIAARVRGVFTHTAPTSPYRGAGRPEASLCIEQVVDAAARELGIDRVALRRRNLIAPDQLPFQTGLSYHYDCGEFERNMDRALELADYAGFESRRAAARREGRLRGLGIANTVEQASGLFDESVDLRIERDGDATLVVGTHSHGQGHETVFKQIVSDRLGLDFERIRIVQGDTDVVRYGHGTGGSRVAALGGSAVLAAAERLVEKGKRGAAHALEVAPEDIEFDDGEYRVPGTDRSVSLVEVAALLHDPLRRPRELDAGLDASGTYVPPGPTFPNGCHLCEVEIDPETGQVAVIDYAVVEDVGRALNPMLVRAQLQGGVVQGFGQAVLEQVVWDDAGQQLSGSLMDYALPRADEAPVCRLELHEVLTQKNPLGAKGAGEAGTVGALPCLMSAVLDALASAGVTELAMPASPVRVWEALRRASARAG